MKKLLYGCLLSIAFLFAGCSQENTMPEISQQEQSLNELKAIAAEYGFPYMPISYESNQPLTDEYRNEFINKHIELKEIRDNAKEVVMPDKTLSRVSNQYIVHNTINLSINNNICRFPVSIYWGVTDGEFTPSSTFAATGGTCLAHRDFSLTHISTKDSESRYPILYFVIRCNITGTDSSLNIKKHIEFILRYDTTTSDLQTTITVLADNYWHPTDFPLD